MHVLNKNYNIINAGYLLKVTKINSQQEKQSVLIAKLVPAKHKNRQSQKYTPLKISCHTEVTLNCHVTSFWHRFLEGGGCVLKLIPVKSDVEFLGGGGGQRIDMIMVEITSPFY